jgi:hypothetical protein
VLSVNFSLSSASTASANTSTPYKQRASVTAKFGNRRKEQRRRLLCSVLTFLSKMLVCLFMCPKNFNCLLRNVLCILLYVPHLLDVTAYHQAQGKRNTGRRNETWRRTTEKMLTNRKLTWETAKQRAKDRQIWKSLNTSSPVYLRH